LGHNRREVTVSFVIVWAFSPQPGLEREFEAAYGPKGSWAELFHESSDFLGTELLRDAKAPDRYLTVDRWRSHAAFDAFYDAKQRDYEILDRACELLTLREERLGSFETVD
jgi:heme-degrading monooxygenase HmoA